MKTIQQLIILFLFLILILPTTSFAQDNVKDIEKKVMDMTQNMAKQMLAGEYSTEHYTDDAISMPNNSPMLEGIEAIKTSGEQMISMGIKFNKVDFVTKQVIVEGNIAMEIGTYDMDMTIPNVPQTTTDKGKYLTIWEIQKNGDLKIKVETWNTDSPPPGM